MARTMTPEECAKYCKGLNPQAIREALKAGVAPFGFATNSTGGRWNYTIISNRFFDYIGEPVPEELKEG